VKLQVLLSEVKAFPFKSLISVANEAVNCVKDVRELLGIKVAVVLEEEELRVTFPETELLDASLSVKVLLEMVELSINSLKVAEMLEITVFAPSAGEVEEIVGAVVSSLNA